MRKKQRPKKATIKIAPDLHQAYKQEAARRRMDLQDLIEDGLRTSGRMKRFLSDDEPKASKELETAR